MAYLRDIDPKVYVTGVSPNPGTETIFIAEMPRVKNGKLFPKLTKSVKLLIPKHGRSLDIGCIVTIPGRQRFFALEYDGDVEGWRKQLLAGARFINAITAFIVSDNFVIDDGRIIALELCDFELLYGHMD